MRAYLLLGGLLVAALVTAILSTSTVNGDKNSDTEIKAIQATLEQTDQGMLRLVAELDGKMPPGEIVTPPETMLVDLLEDIKGTELHRQPVSGGCPVDPRFCPMDIWYWACTYNPETQMCVCVMWLC